MERKQSPSKKQLIAIQEEKLIREINYDSLAETSGNPPKKLFLEILQNRSNLKNSPCKVFVSIKPRAPAIKTLYLAEKKRFNPRKRSHRSGSRLAVGDHSSFTTRKHIFTKCMVASSTLQFINRAKSEIICERTSTSIVPDESTTTVSKCSNNEDSSYESLIHTKHLAEKCYLYTVPQITMTVPKVDKINVNHRSSPKNVDVGTLVPKESSLDGKHSPHITHINRRIDQLERKILKQRLVFHSLDPTFPLTSSDEEEYNDNKMRELTNNRAGCSYIEYSRIPDTSAFQRCSQQAAPLSESKATTIEKEHNSEQYGRNFSLYDGITARGRRQCASVPCKRDDGSKLAAERVHKIRHKLNPVRDYRLMDTVHYLAQGEFAPRDDGIKLTPSREAVLSDIIYEDVCRTHWPSTRLARRIPHADTYGTRSDLQNLIDSLLRERVAHVERRKRRHYRIVKLNHRHENSCRPVGKTGDIIVASHKNKHGNEEIAYSDYKTTNTAKSDNQRNDKRLPKNHQSNEERLVLSELKPNRQADCSPGPSYAVPRFTNPRVPTCCYHTANSNKQIRSSKNEVRNQDKSTQDITSESSTNTGSRFKTPRLVVKKNSSKIKSSNKEEPNLEHYILLPTLVVKTSSNIRRQKRFGELYHRILKVQFNKVLVLSSGQLRQWARGQAEGKLERVILAGQGHRLLAEADALPLPRHLTSLIIKCDALHAAVEKGSLLELQVALVTFPVLD
ncbi:uncharacterized protein LOC112043511 [Bicyclus anynana]|uniref:Uncharacterized protein LOC112043511 n=1 Tax=Bicyclus anynana TaxID=110368 RepID=A0ABM3LR19_BICAN|nr:uncharacterized protein LOC112043511 [Bicyclus anynana]